MKKTILDLAATVIRNVGPGDMADVVMRKVFKEKITPGTELAREASQAVFAYYRWHGWLQREQRLTARVENAVELDQKFQKHPTSFSNADLAEKAVPGWVRERMQVSPEWLRSLQRHPRLWARARLGKGRELAAELATARVAGEGMLADAVEYTGHKDLFHTEAFKEGAFEVQDLSSQAVGWVCGPKPGETWWDACAGEGGKTLHFSDMMGNRGLIWASDRAEWRLQKLKRRAARAMAFNYRSVVWDGGAKLPTKTKFDGILVDAPCSGIGTWGRNPHARWTTTPKDVDELSQVQRRIVAHASAGLKPGGKLFFAVCTLAQAETSEVAAAVDAHCPDLRRMELQNPLAPAGAPSKELWIWPQDFGGNGMFVAGWTKTGKA